MLKKENRSSNYQFSVVFLSCWFQGWCMFSFRKTSSMGIVVAIYVLPLFLGWRLVLLMIFWMSTSHQLDVQIHISNLLHLDGCRSRHTTGKRCASQWSIDRRKKSPQNGGEKDQGILSQNAQFSMQMWKTMLMLIKRILKKTHIWHHSFVGGCLLRFFVRKFADPQIHKTGKPNYLKLLRKKLSKSILEPCPSAILRRLLQKFLHDLGNWHLSTPKIM